MLTYWQCDSSRNTHQWTFSQNRGTCCEGHLCETSSAIFWPFCVGTSEINQILVTHSCPTAVIWHHPRQFVIVLNNVRRIRDQLSHCTIDQIEANAGLEDDRRCKLQCQWYITMTSWWARWRLKSPASPLFTQPFNRAQIKENIKARWSLVFVQGIHLGPMNSPHKWSVTRKQYKP